MQTLKVVSLIMGVVLTFPTVLSYPSDSDELAKIRDVIDILKNETTISKRKECDGEWFLNPDDFTIFSNGTILILANNSMVSPPRYDIIDGKLCVVERAGPVSTEKITASSLDCKEKFIYEPHEYQKLPNGEVSLFNEFVLEEGEFEIDDHLLKICVPDYYYDYGNFTFNFTPPYDLFDDVLLHAGRVGAGISIVALILHLLVFILVPTTRNLPGYILTSMSVAFLMAYCFVQIGQIEEVLGIWCILSASMEHFFFLSAFFWMNVMAFDVLKALRLATHKLVAPSRKIKTLRFLGYCIYAWGIPFILAITALSLDLSNAVTAYKPLFGYYKICWFVNVKAKLVFFVVPAIILFVLNAIFFGYSAFMIVNNTMKDNQQKVAKRNFVLYARLGLIMGVTWLMSIAGVIFEVREVWLVFDILNSLQGLFIFLLFSCNQKTWNYLRKKTTRFSSRGSIRSASIKTTTSTMTKSES